MLHSPQLFIRRMRLTDSMMFTKSFLRKYKRMRLTTPLYGISFTKVQILLCLLICILSEALTTQRNILKYAHACGEVTV